MTLPRPVLARTPLTGPWTLHVDPATPADLVPAAGVAGQVPGAVHDDLHRAGVIADPLHGDHERAVDWVSRANWIYRTVLPALNTAHDRIDLVFGGIDTVSHITLGDEGLGRTRNMHRSYRFDITDVVRRGQNDLAVHLSSPYAEAEALRDFTGPRPNAYGEPFNFIRKMACSFGWDWGITLPGAGLWRPVTVESWSTARLAGIRPLTDVDDGTGILTLAVDVERSESGRQTELVVEVNLDGTAIAELPLPPGIIDATRVLRIPEIRPWAPAGYGEASLYRLTLALRTRDGAPLDRIEHRIGFRHIRLHREADSAGTSFELRLGGRPILVKGANWIPGDVMPGRMTRQRYRQRLRQAAEANINLIRVWGGGLYETAEFYETCDELGLMVWQDFPFACAAYPETPELRDEVRAEAEENVARLSRHPSLVLWNGNNECDWLRIAEEWVTQSGGELDWGERYYHEDLPEIAARVDPSRPYTPTSPWSGRSDIFPNAPSHGTFHSWEVWNRQDYGRYRDTVPRFVAEFGWQAPPSWRTLRDAVTDDPLLPTSPGLLHRQKVEDGMGKLHRGLESHARPRLDIDAWHYLMQWNQVRAVDTAINHWRAHWPTTSGTILWQLNDLWPGISWSTIDSAGRPKPLYFALRDLYAPRCLSIQPGGVNQLILTAMNDTDEPWLGSVLVRRVGDAGFDAARRSLDVAVPPRSVQRSPIPNDLSTFTDSRAEVLVAEADGHRAWWYGCEAKDTEFVGAPPRLDVEEVEGGIAVTITATTLLRDYLIQPDRMHADARVDRGFITLLPGERTRVHVEGPVTAESIREPWAASYLDGVIHGNHP